MTEEENGGENCTLVSYTGLENALGLLAVERDTAPMLEDTIKRTPCILHTLLVH